MRLLLDEMFPAAIAEQLRRRGRDAVAVQERDDLREASDTSVFAAAQGERRAVVTENVADFLPLDNDVHAAGRRHYGLICTTNNSLPRHRKGFVGEAVRRLDDLRASYPEDQTPADLVVWL